MVERLQGIRCKKVWTLCHNIIQTYVSSFVEWMFFFKFVIPCVSGIWTNLTWNGGLVLALVFFKTQFSFIGLAPNPQYAKYHRLFLAMRKLLAHPFMRSRSLRSRYLLQTRVRKMRTPWSRLRVSLNTKYFHTFSRLQIHDCAHNFVSQFNLCTFALSI